MPTDQVKSWTLEKTENMLDEAPAIYGDPKIIEIELAKLRVNTFLIPEKYIPCSNNTL